MPAPDAPATQAMSADERDLLELRVLRDQAIKLHMADCRPEARHAYETLLERWPDDAISLSNYGALLRNFGEFNRSIAVLTKALTINQDNPDSWSNLGNALTELERYDDAIVAFKHCLMRKPSHRDGLANLGVVLDRCGRHLEAITIFDLVLTLTPENPRSHTNRALANLALGNYREGFAEYEWRWRTPHMKTGIVHGPIWDGTPFPGKTLLVYSEGGYGDSIQFCRFIPQASKLGGTIIVLMPRPLITLLDQVEGVSAISDSIAELPAFDLVCPVMSLARALDVTVESVAPGAPYLSADPTLVGIWHERLGKDVPDGGTQQKPMRIGLVWAGGSHLNHTEAAIMNLKRSLKLAMLARLAAAAPDAIFYSLQIGVSAIQGESPPPGMKFIDHTRYMTSFSETAAFMTCLDLVISVDTSCAHLAGSLGVPVWVLSRYDQCWRWLSKRTDSPWYEKLRLFQQQKPNDWDGVVQGVCRDLSLVAAEHGSCVLSESGA